MPNFNKLMAKLNKILPKTGETAVDDAARAVLRQNPEKYQEYLNLLDKIYGDRSVRSEKMGFSPETLYHGSFSNIDKFNKNKSSPEGFLGKSTYLTNSPDDAYYNYATKEGPDIVAKLERRIIQLQAEKDLNYTAAKELAEAELFHNKDEGSIYPVRTKVKNTADLTKQSNQYLDFSPKINKDGDIVKENPVAEKIVKRLQGKTDDPFYLDQDMTPRQLRDSVTNATEFSQDTSGNLMGTEYGRQALQDAKFDSAKINAKEEFKNMPNIDYDTQHTMVFNPKDIRSVNAAYDPRFKDSSDIMAGGAGVALGLGMLGSGNEAKAEEPPKKQSDVEKYGSFRPAEPTDVDAMLFDENNIQKANMGIKSEYEKGLNLDERANRALSAAALAKMSGRPLTQEDMKWGQFYPAHDELPLLSTGSIKKLSAAEALQLARPGSHRVINLPSHADVAGTGKVITAEKPTSNVANLIKQSNEPVMTPKTGIPNEDNKYFNQLLDMIYNKRNK